MAPEGHPHTVRFDEALRHAMEHARYVAAALKLPVLLVRDLFGRISLAIDDRGGSVDEQRCQVFEAELDRLLGRYASPASVVLASQLIEPSSLFDDTDATTIDVEANLRLLERLVTGADWARPQLGLTKRRRVTTFGVKGGVGRTTATSVLAWALAEKDQRVLVIDLDLESPGIGATLLPPEEYPEYGVVDYFVEDAVGQGRELLRDCVTPSRLGYATSGRGSIVVAPANGRWRDGYDYHAKLARVYVEQPGEGRPRDFAHRLAELVTALEEETKPDITLLDSRAGLHDIAAVCLTRLDALGLLFAVDTPQTWLAYRFLMSAWRAHPELAAQFRDNLKLVAALMPETETDAYFQRTREHAYDLFVENLYEEALPEDLDAFTFDLKDEDAPHFPLRIHWSRTFQQFDPVGSPEAVTKQQIQAAFGDFVEGVCSLAVESPQ